MKDGFLVAPAAGRERTDRLATGSRAVRGALGLAVALALVGMSVAGCGGGGSSITVTGAWVRNSPSVAGAGAAYMIIKNNGTASDAVVGASSPAAATLEIHQTMAMGSPMPGASGGGGMLGMVPVERLDLPAGGSVELKPGGFHIMLVQLRQALKVGDRVDITLKFERAGEITVKAEVREG